MPVKMYHTINAITLYRLLSAPVLLFLVFINCFTVFKWLLLISFFTDAIDGFLARHYKIASRFGARLDSIADDFTVLAGTIALIVYRPLFFQQQFAIFLLVFVLFAVQGLLALLRYGKTSAFHTYLAKLAAILQGLFLISFFFTDPLLPLFYVAAMVTGIQLIEEILLVLLLPNPQVNVKGLFWALRNKS